MFPLDAAEALATTKTLNDAQRIEFNGVFQGQEGFEVLITNPHLSGVRELALIYCDWHYPTVGPQFTYGLARSHFHSLEVLELIVVNLDEKGFETLINSPDFSRLRHVCIGDCSGLTDASIDALVNSPWWHQLQSLFFDSIDITEAATDILINAPPPKQLQHFQFDPATLNGTHDALVERFGDTATITDNWYGFRAPGFKRHPPITHDNG